MRIVTLVVCTAFISVASAAYGGTKKATSSFPVRYAGGRVGLKQNRSMKAVVSGNEVIFVQHRRRVSVPVQSISEISCAEDVQRGFGAVLGRVPVLDLEKTQTHYVGLTWANDTGTGPNRSEVVLKLSDGEYRNFVSALERLTGKPAVDTKKTPTSVRYD